MKAVLENPLDRQTKKVFLRRVVFEDAKIPRPDATSEWNQELAVQFGS